MLKESRNYKKKMRIMMVATIAVKNTLPSNAGYVLFSFVVLNSVKFKNELAWFCRTELC